MNENLKAFMKYVSEHEEVAAKFDALKEEQDEQKVVGATVAIAKEYGFELTAEDFVHEELSEKELEAVAGGGEACFCFAGGGGNEGGDGDVCACVAVGAGLAKDASSGDLRCCCMLLGEGDL